MGLECVLKMARAEGRGCYKTSLNGCKKMNHWLEHFVVKACKEE